MCLTVQRNQLEKEVGIVLLGPLPFLHRAAGQPRSYLIGHIGVHILPVWGHGDGLIFTDVTLNRKRHNTVLEADDKYGHDLTSPFLQISCLGYCDKYN